MILLGLNYCKNYKRFNNAPIAKYTLKKIQVTITGLALNAIINFAGFVKKNIQKVIFKTGIALDVG